MVSVIVTTGSTYLNAHVRANCLWRCVNSMHDDPGRPFELIVVDNCDGQSVHREAIDRIRKTYRTVTHVVTNRLNEFHGGGVRQGLLLADGDLLVQSADDLEYKPGWLRALTAPLEEFPGEQYIGALLPGHNCRSRVIGHLSFKGWSYQIRNRAAAYVWAFWRRTVDELGVWRRAHFADTRWSQKAMASGYRWTVPIERFAEETNLNYLRPWNYREVTFAKENKRKYLELIWSSGALTSMPPCRPARRFPLRNPEGEGPGCYSDDFLFHAGELRREGL